ncbi:hypothetical protein G6F24_017041 [Rhizopus arrhizus]|nr:hypothetical protein G6F24_017041 [Rhizopus arrhizus]
MLAFILQRFRARIRFFPMSQQMLAIGRALMTNPDLLILDEATEGRAPKIREEIWNCLARLRQAGHHPVCSLPDAQPRVMYVKDPSGNQLAFLG